MQKILFTSDYRGSLTAERFYEAGAVAEFDDETAAEIVKRGRAEFVNPPAPTTRTKRGQKVS